jgi:hypothetical protein
VYSEEGFGAEYSWGVLHPNTDSAGRDDSWFHDLDDAFINSGASKRPLPTAYEVR